MNILSQININHASNSIQLLQGDLTDIPKEHAVDILVISAYPGSYVPVPGTLVDALNNKGVILKDLAADKEVDLLKELGCWLSKPLSKEQQEKFNFKRILCFEPHNHTASPETIVGNVFRCINTFAFDNHINNIALPVLASGNQKAPLEKMMPAILDAALFWLENGLPLNSIKLVLHRQNQVDVALPIFISIKNRYKPEISFIIDELKAVTAPPFIAEVPEQMPGRPYQPQTGNNGGTGLAPVPAVTPPSPSVAKKEYDFFISYSHRESSQVKKFVTALKQKNNALNIFYDKSSIPAGGLWIRQISEAIQNSKAVICILTPEYSKSDVCWDEFQCAKVMELRRKRPIIKTINFLMDENLPPMMAIYSYIDCTEGDMKKLMDAIADIIEP